MAVLCINLGNGQMHVGHPAATGYLLIDDKSFQVLSLTEVSFSQCQGGHGVVGSGLQQASQSFDLFGRICRCSKCQGTISLSMAQLPVPNHEYSWPGVGALHPQAAKVRPMKDLLERFCRYVRIETTADEEADTYPSSSGQTELGRLLVRELKELGLEATIDENSIVTATLPSTVEHSPTICWLAHLDTSPEASGKDVDPQVVRGYRGGDIVLKSGLAIPAQDLTGFEGKTLVTTDGTTLLGADDKAGIAVIMTALDRLLKQPDRPRWQVRVVTEAGQMIGVLRFDVVAATAK